RALQVDRPNLLGQSKIGQLEAVGAERVRLEYVCTRMDVLQVHFRDQVRLCEVELVEAAVQEDAARVQHRAHRAIGHEHAFAECIKKGAGHVADWRIQRAEFWAGTSRSSLSQTKSLLL